MVSIDTTRLVSSVLNAKCVCVWLFTSLMMILLRIDQLLTASFWCVGMRTPACVLRRAVWSIDMPSLLNLFIFVVRFPVDQSRNESKFSWRSSGCMNMHPVIQSCPFNPSSGFFQLMLVTVNAEMMWNFLGDSLGVYRCVAACRSIMSCQSSLLTLSSDASTAEMVWYHSANSKIVYIDIRILLKC